MISVGEALQSTPKSRIAELREQAELTQAQLAVLVGVTTNTIQNWESGKSGVEQIIKFLKLCTVLNCNLQDLIEDTPNKSVEDVKPGSFSLQDLQALRRRWGTDKPASPKTKTQSGPPSTKE